MDSAGAGLNASSVHHPAVIFANGYGDHYLNLPAIRALACLFNGRLTLAGIAGAIEQITHDLPLRQVIGAPMRHNGTGRSFDAAMVAERIGPCDLLISMNPWQSRDLSELVRRLAPPCSIGFFDNYTIEVKRDYGKHAVDLSFDFVRLFRPDWQPESFAQPPRFAGDVVASAAKIRQALPCGHRILCIHPDTLPEKMWPEARWVEFIDRFLERHRNWCVLIIGLRGIDSIRCRQAQAVIPAYRLPIPVSALLLAGSDLFVGVDSVFLHIADMYRIPTIALFGPTPAREWGLRFGPGKHLKAGDDLHTLTTERVLSAVADIVEYCSAPSDPGDLKNPDTSFNYLVDR